MANKKRPRKTPKPGKRKSISTRSPQETGKAPETYKDPSPSGKMAKRRRVYSKANVPLHQEFLDTEDAPLTARNEDDQCVPPAEMGNEENSVECELFHKSGNEELCEEQLISSPANALIRDALICQPDCGSGDSLVPSPQGMDVGPFLTGASVYETSSPSSSPFLSDTLPETELDFDGILKEILQKSRDLSSVAEITQSSQYCATQSEGDIFIDVEMDQELSNDLFDENSLMGSTLSNLCQEYAKCNKVDSSAQSTTDTTDQQTPFENADATENDPQSSLTGKEATMSSPPPTQEPQENRDDIKDKQLQVDCPTTTDAEDLQNIPSKAGSSDEVKSNSEPNLVRSQILANFDKPCEQGSNTPDMFGDLNLSPSQFLDIDIKCQQMDKRAQPSEPNPPEPCPSQSLPGFMAQTAPNLNWTQEAAQSQKRLQSIIQEISRLNAMVIRARRTLWPQQQQNQGSSRQYKPVALHHPTPHPKKNARAPQTDAAESYPDWNYS